MKNLRTTLGFTLGAVALLAASAFAQTGMGHSTLPPGRTSDPTLYDINAVTITQSTSATIVSLNSVACNANDGSGTTPNSYWRRFNLDGAHGILTPFTVSSVDYGIETVDGAGINVTVNLYQILNAAPLTIANLSPIGSSGAVFLAPQNLVIKNQPVAGLINPLTHDLVVEIASADGRPNFNHFFIGSNNLGQSGLSYLSAVDCGISQPTSTAAIGFPNMMIVMAVTGAENPTGTISNTWGRVKTLYR